MATFNGTAGNDTYAGTSDDDSILGLAGDDALNGAGGNDTIEGGDDNDLITGGDGNDLLNGGDGADDVSGEDGDDTLYGSDGSDVLDGGDDDDELILDGLLATDGILGTAYQIAVGATTDFTEVTSTTSASANTSYTPTDTADLTQDATGGYNDGDVATSTTSELTNAEGSDLGSAIAGFQDGSEANYVSDNITTPADLVTDWGVTDGTQQVVETTTFTLATDDVFQIDVNGQSATFITADYATIGALVTAINNSDVGTELVADVNATELRLTANQNGPGAITVTNPGGIDATDDLAFAETTAGVADANDTFDITHDGDTHTFTIGNDADESSTLTELVGAINAAFGFTFASVSGVGSDVLELNSAQDDFTSTIVVDNNNLGANGVDDLDNNSTTTAPQIEANDQLTISIDGTPNTYEIGEDSYAGEINTLGGLIAAINADFGAGTAEAVLNGSNFDLTLEGEEQGGNINTTGSDAAVETGLFGANVDVDGTAESNAVIEINGTPIGELGTGTGEINTLADLVSAINTAALSGLTVTDNGTSIDLEDTDSDILFTGQTLGIADGIFTAAAQTATGNDETTSNIEMVTASNGSLDLTSASEQYLIGSSLSVDTSPDGEEILDVDAANGVMSFDGATITDDSGDAWQVVGLGSDSRDYGDAGVFTTTLSDGSTVAYDPTTGSLTYTPADDLELLQNGEEHDGGTLDVVFEDVNGATFTETFDFTVTGDQTIDLFDGGNSFTGGDEDEDVNGTDEADTAIGNGGDDSFVGGDGNDTWWAGQTDDGDDSLSGGVGDDTMGGGTGDDTLLGGEGNDELFGGEGEDDLFGDAGDDTIWAGDDDDDVNGGDGDDLLGGGLLDDVIDGGAGDDTIYSGSDDGTDAITGGDGDDLIYGGAGDNDNVDGGDGDDELYNGSGDDDVIGGDGEDTLWGGAGDDNLDLGTDGFDDFVGFISGNGNDTVFGFELAAGSNGTIGDVVDLTAFSFADTQAVIDAMTDDGGDAVLALAPGQTVTFDSMTVSEFQSATDDWVLV